MRVQQLRELLQERIVVFDGAMGTQIQALNLNAHDFGGEEFEGCNEYLNITQPELIANIHRAYFEAGADFVETNTFGATGLVLDEYGLKNRALEINKAAAQIAKNVAKKFDKYVAGSMGPTTKSISVTGGVTFDALTAYYAEQAQGLIEGGVDLLLLETGQDTLNIKAG
jgi:5-methyltetrahydrofolate--homocysteine methyltransferase